MIDTSNRYCGQALADAKATLDNLEICGNIMYNLYTIPKNLLGKDRRRQLSYYVNLIKACKKVLYQLVYIGKKFVYLKEPLYLINQ